MAAPALTAGTFEAVLAEYRPALLRYARRLVGDDDAEDVLQAALERGWRAMSRGELVDYPNRWLYLIVKRQAINVYVARAARPALGDDVELTHDYRVDVERQVEDRDEARRTLQAVAQLPSRQREELERELGGRQETASGGDRMSVYRGRLAVRASVRPPA